MIEATIVEPETYTEILIVKKSTFIGKYVQEL